MCLDFRIIRKEELKTKKWSGGTTTELLIYPNDAVYSEGNFKWRVSSAEVQVEESTFTSLPGISRIIMIIDGELRLEHKDHHNAVLRAFDQDSFSGDWVTQSFGKVTDYNLMLAEGCTGQVEVITINANQCEEITFECYSENKDNYNQISELYYLVKGDIEIINDLDEEINIGKGDLISITREVTNETISIKFKNKKEKESKIIRTVIFY